MLVDGVTRKIGHRSRGSSFANVAKTIRSATTTTIAHTGHSASNHRTRHYHIRPISTSPAWTDGRSSAV
jgi:hypothetical protein